MKKILTLGLALFGLIATTNAQNWNQIVKTVASDRSDGDYYGIDVAVSGEYAVVSASGEDDDENGLNPLSNAGSAYILKKDGNGNWNEYQKIVASDRGVDNYFGNSVAIFGGTVVIGSNLDDYDENGLNYVSNSGSAYIFELNANGDWVEVQKIVCFNRETNDSFGGSVDINDDYIVVGAKYQSYDQDENNYVVGAGAVYVFEQDGSGEWVGMQKLVAEFRGQSDIFGEHLSLYDDCIAIGAGGVKTDEFELNPLYEAGAVYVFNLDLNDTWVQTQKIVASDRNNDYIFGASLDMEDSLLVVSSMLNDYDENNSNFLNFSGAAYTFELGSNGTWVETQKIVASDRSSDDYFGGSVAVSEGVIVVGAGFSSLDENGENYISNSGAIYVYEQDINSNWVENTKLTAFQRAVNDQFGRSALAVYEGTIMVGSAAEDEDVNEQNTMISSGSLYIFGMCRSSSSVNLTSCGSYLSPSGNYTYTQSGVYIDTIPNVEMCDSVITINLNVISFDQSVTNNITSLIANESGASYQWLDCDNGYQPISGETNQTFNVTANGNYAVEITKNSCIQTSACVEVNSLNVMESQQIKTVNIYPNPANNNVTIETELPSSVSVTDINGKVVYVNNNAELNKLNVSVSNWETGVYFIQVINQNGLSTQKLIVQ